MAQRDVSITIQMVIRVDDEVAEEYEGQFDTSDLARAFVRELEGMDMGILGDHIIDQYVCGRYDTPFRIDLEGAWNGV